MLIITRRVGETIVIGKDGQITVTVMSIAEGQKVKFLFNHPESVEINTEEQRKNIDRHLNKGRSKEGS